MLDLLLYFKEADAANYTVSIKSLTCVNPGSDLNDYSDATGGVGYQAGDELEIEILTGKKIKWFYW